MLNTLLFIHLIIAVLLVTAVLLQKTSTDGLSGIGGGSATGGMGVVSRNTANKFLTKTTVILAVLFFSNAIILANLSSKTNISIDKKIETINQEQSQDSLPIAK